jgi:serine/threonine-protein kinase RsbW
MTRARDFPLQTTSVGAARRFADEVLHGLPAETVEAVRLMVSELATNSIQHAKTGFQLVINRRRDSVRIEVTDLAGGLPAVQSPGPTDPTGRGLAIVEMLSDAWGVDYLTATDKTVWFTLAWERRVVCAHR